VPSSTVHNLMEASRQSGCPVCRLEGQAVERYLDSHFYENVNSTSWRSHLRASHGFCYEHAWLAVNKRLGDALGFTIIYHDIVKNLIPSFSDDESATRAPRGRGSVLGQATDSLRKRVEALLDSLTPRKRCPACEHRDETTRSLITVLLKELSSSPLREAFVESAGLCLPHLRFALTQVRDRAAYDVLLTIHRAKLEGLKAELAEFIRKNDYQVIQEGFGKEGDAWLRTIGMIVGSRKEK
jgi:hypothetical protein